MNTMSFCQDIPRLQPFECSVRCHTGEQLVQSCHCHLPRFHIVYLQSTYCKFFFLALYLTLSISNFREGDCVQATFKLYFVFLCSLAAVKPCASWFQTFQLAPGAQAGTVAMLALVATCLLGPVLTAAGAEPSGMSIFST